MQLFFLFLFFFFVCTHWEGHWPRNQKKKRPGVFFQTPSGHWAINAQWDSVRWQLPKKKKGNCTAKAPGMKKSILSCDFRAEASYRLKKRASDDKASYRLKKRILPAQASSNIKPLLALSGPYPLDTTLCKNFSRGHLAHWLIWPLGTQCNMKPILALSGPYLWSTPLCKIFSKGHLAH